MITKTIVSLGTINRKVASYIVEILAKTKITPNQVTIFRLLFFVPLIAFFFARGGYFNNLLAVFCYSLFFLLDHVDGQLARFKSMGSELGAFMEDFGDRVTIIVALMSIAFGLSRTSGSLLPFFLVFFLFSLDNLQEVIAFKKRYEFGVQTSPDEREKLREKFKQKGIPWPQKLFFNLIYLGESPLLYVFAKVYPLVIGIVLDRLLIALSYMLVSEFVYLIAMIYVSADFTKENPSLMIVRLINKINKPQ